MELLSFDIRTETWEGYRWTRTDPTVNVEPSEPTDHQLLFRKKWTVVPSYNLDNQSTYIYIRLQDYIRTATKYNQVMCATNLFICFFCVDPCSHPELVLTFECWKSSLGGVHRKYIRGKY